MTGTGNRSTALFTIAAGILFIAIGAYRGEIMTVLNNAVIICLECIGIG
jgi:hypothetical protein